jgi:hypothetical protein
VTLIQTDGVFLNTAVIQRGQNNRLPTRPNSNMTFANRRTDNNHTQSIQRSSKQTPYRLSPAALVQHVFSSPARSRQDTLIAPPARRAAEPKTL